MTTCAAADYFSTFLLYLLSVSIAPFLTLLSPKKMSAATLFIPLSEKSIRDSWIGDWRDKHVTNIFVQQNTQYRYKSR